MRLGKPPIVEAWIEFHMRGSDTESTWPEGIRTFLGQIEADYPEVEQQLEESFQVVQRAPGGMPLQISMQGTLKRVRAFDAARGRCVQVGRNVLIVNLIRRESSYEGFRLLLPLALGQLERYVGVFRPQCVLQAALHYTDLVRIPRNTQGPVQLEDYFRIGVQVPDEADWLIGRLAVELSIKLDAPSNGGEELLVGFRRERSDPGGNEDLFRMDWHATCSALTTLDNNEIGKRIEALHESLKNRFRTCFTDRTWMLFEEEEDS